MVNISIDRLEAEIVKTFTDYTEAVSEAIEAKVDEVADQVLAEAKSLAPKRTGNYAKGLRKTSSNQQGKSRRIIWNKKFYRLVHLLEFGHATSDGGRTRAFPHMRPAYEKYGAQLPDHIKRIIRRGGA